MPRSPVSPSDSLSLKKDLVRFLESKIAKWWIPDDFLFVPALPKVRPNEAETGRFEARDRDRDSQRAGKRKQDRAFKGNEMRGNPSVPMLLIILPATDERWQA